MNSTAANETNARLFVAIHVPAEIQSRLAAVQAKIRAALRSGVIRWTHFEQLHLTLRFLGSVPRPQIPRLQGALAEAARRSGAVDLEALGVGCFPNPNRPRVLWAGVRADAQLMQALHAAVQTETDPFTQEREDRAYRPHLTLGRLKEPGRPLRELQALLETETSTEFGRWHAAAIHLRESQLSPQGARHITVQSFPLRAN